MEDEQYQKLEGYALKLLSFRPRSRKEIQGKLKVYSIKKGISGNIVERVIDYLLKQNLINDEEFAKWWLDQRQSFRPKGERVIRMELANKGISKETIDKILTVTSEQGLKEVDLAKKVIDKKNYVFKNLSAKERKIKLSQLLARRGFDWETISQAIDSES